HPLLGQQCGQTHVTVAGVVVDDREVAGTLGDERIDQLHGLPGATEPADHDGGPIGDAGDGGLDVRHGLIDHDAPWWFDHLSSLCAHKYAIRTTIDGRPRTCQRLLCRPARHSIASATIPAVVTMRP